MYMYRLLSKKTPHLPDRKPLIIYNDHYFFLDLFFFIDLPGNAIIDLIIPTKTSNSHKAFIVPYVCEKMHSTIFIRCMYNISTLSLNRYKSYALTVYIYLYILFSQINFKKLLVEKIVFITTM